MKEAQGTKGLWVPPTSTSLACPSWELATGVTTAPGDKESRRLVRNCSHIYWDHFRWPGLIPPCGVPVGTELTVSLCTGAGLLTAPAVPNASFCFVFVCLFVVFFFFFCCCSLGFDLPRLTETYTSPITSLPRPSEPPWDDRRWWALHHSWGWWDTFDSRVLKPATSQGCQRLRQNLLRWFRREVEVFDGETGTLGHT